jgi:hypothetical protein
LHAFGRVQLDGRIELLVHKIWRYPPAQRHLVRPACTIESLHIGAGTIQRARWSEKLVSYIRCNTMNATEQIKTEQVNIKITGLVCRQITWLLAFFYFVHRPVF